MTKYILKESELREIISEAIREELASNLDEGLLKTLGKVAKTASILLAPTYLPQMVADKASGVINRGEKIFKNNETKKRKKK